MKSYVSTEVLLLLLGGIIYFLTKSNKPIVKIAKEEFSSSMPTLERDFVNPSVLSPEQVNTNQVQDPATGLLQTMPDNVNKFLPVDDDTTNSANLKDAFSSPIPIEALPDEVDMNKNNVKNYNAKDFLPKEVQSEWFDTDFTQAKYDINDDVLINTDRYVIGVNTVGQSLKNASYDVRGTIPNPKFTVSPWNNSTYEPDFNLKPLC
jgi:hypothetical protein